MSSMQAVLAEDRRLVILRALDEANGTSLNEAVLKRMLEHVGHRVGRDQVRQDVAWMADSGLVRVEKLADPAAPGELWVVLLRDDGRDVARGRPFPGVARPGLG